MKEMTTAEKTLKVKEDMAKGRFHSIEEACKHYKFAPASYYNHAKKVPFVPGGLPATPTTSESWTKNIEALRKENEALKAERDGLARRLSKLEKKFVSVALGEASI